MAARCLDGNGEYLQPLGLDRIQRNPYFEQHGFRTERDDAAFFLGGRHLVFRSFDA